MPEVQQTRNSPEEQAAYWTKWLTNAPPILDLPVDHPRSPVQSFLRGRATLWLGLPFYLELQACCIREGIGLFGALLAAFSILLHRYTAQDEIVIGSISSDSTLQDEDAVIRQFTNLIPLQCQVSPYTSIRQLFQEVTATLTAAAANRDYPFEDLVAQGGVQPDTDRAPIFQVMLAITDAPDGISPKPITRGNLTEVSEYMTRADLVLLASETDQGLLVQCEYDAELFEPDTILRTLEHFRMVLTGIVHHLEGCVLDIPFLSETERHQLVVGWNDTRKTRPLFLNLPQLFEGQVERRPHAVAAIFEGEQVTYQTLNCRANRLAHRLRALGVGPESLVGIYVARSLDMLTALLGILKARAAYVPLDPTYPQERLGFMLADTKMPVLVTQRQYGALLPAHKAQVIYVDVPGELPTAESDSNPVEEIDPSSLAYVIYTSGSTGRPKGVQVPHRALANFLEALRERSGLTSNDILLAITTLSFDIAALELFLPLIVGARVVIASRTVASDGALLSALLRTSSATVMQATPATWQMLLDSGWRGRSDLKILCGGEALPGQLAARLLEQGAELWNLYGPTETTVWSAAYRVVSGARSELIGGPLDNTQLYLLDSSLQPVPIGVPAELAIGGDGVSRGYLNRPDLTAEKFIPDPFADTPGVRLYRTGDLARRLWDGRIEFLGRTDYQVKIRGFRVELGEVEATLRHCPGVRSAVVVAREDTSGAKRMVAYIVPDELSVPSISELRHALEMVLANYMIPSSFVYLKALPLTPNGKVDRRALLAFEEVPAELLATYAAPRTEVERRIAEIWRDVLHVRQVGIHDNFFDLGGHSLLLAQIQARLHQLFGRELSTLELMAHPTVSALSRYLSLESEEMAAASQENRDQALEVGKHRRQQLLQLRRGRKTKGRNASG